MSKINLHFGDCLEVMDDLIAKGVKVDAIITDPPYDISTTNVGGTINNVKKLNKSLKDLTILNITKGYDIVGFGEKAIKIMNEINICFWCNKKQIPAYLDFWVGKHKCIFDIVCWHKTNALPTYSNKLLSDTEYCLCFRKGKGKCFPTSYEDAQTFYIAPINYKDKKLYKHPTIKPLNTIERLIRNFTRENQTVLDPFMGSGTTGVACKNLNRNFIGIELDLDYFLIADKRINTA